MYAGLIVCAALVPSVFCERVPSGILTYEQIYNSTSYAQLDHLLTPHTATERRNSTQGYTPLRGDESRFKDKYEISSRSQLLVGFARDPFRQSIPEVDYRKGVRVLDAQPSADRGKRGVVHLYNMLTCATGCDPLAYKGYGCYCGLLGEGRPTDGIDNCCRIHDECYDKFHCPFYTVYFQPYYWKCYHGEPLCARENHIARKGVNSCAGQLCECDRRFAMCVKRYTCPRGKALCRSSPLRLLQNILMSYR
ncbi:jg6116 [Pararge aegeria aegeria]|uniref:Phospholipase A2 n=1 Tax=Pararge aegeria aegeria TaxID=348720 RepID=A0A8S4REA2_9NEOP|nr:jg6116 [Pararge aegeria aegeria]